ncbi:hypothetical protein E2C01_054019 [Portunus trituberculatus]|uniref:Uncharacterized protein n=1 Tax=Portunus trituberculatus TaxID=210409 RepID=A0A5B7GRM4_PORTR|nr:hypothetical protein [Portunus trituberculatus]
MSRKRQRHRDSHPHAGIRTLPQEPQPLPSPLIRPTHSHTSQALWDAHGVGSPRLPDARLGPREEQRSEASQSVFGRCMGRTCSLSLLQSSVMPPAAATGVGKSGHAALTCPWP